MKPDSSRELVQMAETRRVTRTELAFVLLLFLVGTALRCAYPSRMAVEHFDEGVYASDCWFGPDDDFHYPDQHLYAPPLLPTLIWWSTTLFGPSNLAVMLPSLVAGCLTIPLVWWIGRSWFNAPLGFVGAVLATFSDLHILFCRTALTDVLLTFWLLLAVYFFWRALTNGGLWSLLASGVFTGLAWWTKYSGWLPLAITLSAGLAWWIYGRWFLELRADSDRRQSATSMAWRWCVVAVVTLAIWSLWWLQLQREGGYSAVAANHRGYFVGLSGWLDSFERQWQLLVDTGGWLTVFGLGLYLPYLALAAWALHRFEPESFTWNETDRSGPAPSSRDWLGLAARGLFVVGPVALVAGAVPPIYALGLLLLEITARLIRSLGVSFRNGFGRLSTWLVLAWGLGLMVSVPLYVPYPRLLVPLIAAGWLGAAGFLFAVLTREKLPLPSAPATQLRQPKFTPRDPAQFWESLNVRFMPVVGLLLVAASSPIISSRGVPAWQDRTGLAQIGRQIVKQIAGEPLAGGDGPDTPTAIVYTYADPALLFQLRQSGASTVRPVSSLGFAEPGAQSSPVPVYVVVGPQAHRTAGFAEQFARAEPRLELIAEYEFSPSDVVLLDNREPEDRPPATWPRKGGPRPTYRQQLFRVR